MKIIGAGMPKTGTKTLRKALETLGYDVHDHFEQIRYHSDVIDKILDNKVTAEDFKRSFEHTDVIVDVPFNCFWEHLLESFPDAKVILTVRDNEDVWYASVVRHYRKMGENWMLPTSKFLDYFFYPVLGPFGRKYIGQMTELNPVFFGSKIGWKNCRESITRYKYRQHNTYVKAQCPNSQLLVYNVKEGWEPLCRFLGKPIPEAEYPIENVGATLIDEITKGTYKYDCGITKQMQQEMKWRFIVYLSLWIGVAAYLIYIVFNLFS